MNDEWMTKAVERFKRAIGPKPPLRGGPGLVISDEMIRDGLRAALDPIDGAMWWWCDDGEWGYDDADEALEDADIDAIREVRGALRLANAYAGNVCLTVDSYGDPEETESKFFRTPEEANSAWPESLAAARAKATEGRE